MARDVYADVTASIIDQLEAGVRPWTRGYDLPPSEEPLRHNGVPYRGVNVLLLGMVALAHGYTSPYWMTLRQANKLDARVRKGEHGTTVVFAKTVFAVTSENEDGETSEQAIPILRGYTVYNADQIEGLGPKYHPLLVRVHDPSTRPDEALAFFDGVGATVKHIDAGVPCYIPSLDEIRIPHPSMFHGWDGYVSTLAHEHVHWTGTKDRLDRDLRGRFGSEAYGMEELTAELGAAFVCATLHVCNIQREDNAAYIDGWLRVLKKDKRAIFNVSNKAQMACDFLCLGAQFDHAANETEEGDDGQA